MAKAKSNSPEKAKETKRDYVVVYKDFEYWVADVEEGRTLSEVKKEYDFGGTVYIYELPKTEPKAKSTNFVVLE